MTYKIMEVKHHAPYDGCFWEYNYFLIEHDEHSPEVLYKYTPIYNSGATKHRLMLLSSAVELYGAALIGDDNAKAPKQWFYSDPRIHELDDSLWDKLPTNLIPTFHTFFNGGLYGETEHNEETGFTFKWNCETCGMTANYPLYMSGYTGNGGIGINVSGWICENCPDLDDTTVWCPTCGEQWDSESIKTIEYDSYQGTDEEFDALLNSVERVPDEQMALDGFKKPVWIRNYDYIEAVIVDSDDNSHCPYCHGQLEA